MFLPILINQNTPEIFYVCPTSLLISFTPYIFAAATFPFGAFMLYIFFWFFSLFFKDKLELIAC